MGRLQKIVTFDFDQTILLEDNSINHEMVTIIRFHAEQGHKCYIVTARCKEHETKKWMAANQPDRVRVKDFIELHNLPIKQVHFTNHEPKGATLWRVGSTLHYDDKPEEIRSAKDYGIKGILVKKSQKEE